MKKTIVIIVVSLVIIGLAGISILIWQRYPSLYQEPRGAAKNLSDIGNEARNYAQIEQE